MTRGGGIPAMMPFRDALSNRRSVPAREAHDARDPWHRRRTAAAEWTTRRNAVHTPQALKLLFASAKYEALFAQATDECLVSDRRKHCSETSIGRQSQVVSPPGSR